MRTSTIATLGSLSLALSLGFAVPASSEDKVGVVTTVVGPVTVTRASTPAEPLKFKDDIFLRDRVTTGDSAMTRILMGGKVVVTARERSTLTITEVPGLSTIDLSSGRIAVAVDKTRMKPGERVHIRTPNAIAGVRGTVLIVETFQKTSTVTVLTGLVEVVRLDPATGGVVGPVTPVAAQQTVSVRNNVLPPRAQNISRERAERLSQEFTPPMRTVSASSVMPVEAEVARATAVLDALVPPPTSLSAVAPTASALTASSALVKPTTTVTSTGTASILTAPALTSTASILTAPALTPTAPLATAPALTPTTVLAPTTSLLQPIVQPVVQSVVQPVLQPVTNLLK
jgi:hypothetical protein